MSNHYINALLENIERHARHGRDSAFLSSHPHCLIAIDHFQTILDDIERIQGQIEEEKADQRGGAVFNDNG